MKCEHNNCTRTATTKTQEYHPDKRLCTYHGNKVKEEGRRKGKMVRRRWEGEDVSKGKIDYIRSWKRCLTQQEIALEYTKRLDLDITTKPKKMNEINLSAWITEYWEEHGFNPETTQSILNHIQEVLSDQAIKVEIEVITDDNFYEHNQH
tara:strand:- start:334 stop:783 length:450 start_codon:yes stop_codon:yes gene_type:complete